MASRLALGFATIALVFGNFRDGLVSPRLHQIERTAANKAEIKEALNEFKRAIEEQQEKINLVQNASRDTSKLDLELDETKKQLSEQEAKLKIQQEAIAKLLERNSANDRALAELRTEIEALNSKSKTIATQTAELVSGGSQAVSIDNGDAARAENSIEKPAIVVLTAAYDYDIERLVIMMPSMDIFMDDNAETPLLIFHEGDLNNSQKARLLNVTNRPVEFPVIDFKDFPDGFNPDAERWTDRRGGKWMTLRGDWGYMQMCRFWITRLWKHPAIKPYSTIMRMDTDSCLKAKPTYPLPNLKFSSTVYKANARVTDSAKYTTGLLNATLQYINANGLTPKNQELWKRFYKSNGREMYYTNFEISRKSFFQREDVMKFQEALTEQEPFGVFRWRWGDAPIRLATLAIFGEPHEIDESHTQEYYLHKNGCNVHFLQQIQNERWNATH